MNQRAASRVKKRQQYVRYACNQCKKRKVKCTGERCCQQCATHRVRCTYGGVTTSSTGPSLQASSKHEALDDIIVKLQTKLDKVLQHMRRTSPNDQTRDTELHALLLQTAQKVDTCQATLAGKDTPRQRPDGGGSDSQLLMLDLPTASPSFTPDELLVFDESTPESTPSIPFSGDQALELIEYFRFEADCFYPFIPFDNLTLLASIVMEPVNGTHDFSLSAESENWDDMVDNRNTDMLKIVLACALASRLKKETEDSRSMMCSVSEKLTIKLSRPNFDTKDIALAALLGVYHLQCDETVLAWRKISIVAKMCQELGLHKTTKGHPQWVTRMFWCIYVLDKRFSFMVNLPFTLQDSEIEHVFPEYDDCLKYISPLIKYVRIAARFVPTMPKLGTSYIELEASTRTSIDIEADQWAISTSVSTSPNAHYTKADEAQFHKSFVTVCRNQLKIGLYKHILFSLPSIAQNALLSHKAVFAASETIQSCFQLQKSTTMYHLQAVHFNFFVLSAVAVLYLAVRHAPLEFGDTPREIFTGLEILRPYCTYGRLRERVQALDKAMRRLGYDGMGIGPQLALNEGPETLYSVGGDWAEEMQESEQLMGHISRLESFSPSQSQAQADPWNDGTWVESSTPASRLWHPWEN